MWADIGNKDALAVVSTPTIVDIVIVELQLMVIRTRAFGQCTVHKYPATA